MTEQPKTLWQDVRFLLLFLGQGSSYFGDGFAAIALPVLVIQRTHSGLLMGFVGAMETAPMFFLGFLAGVVADLWSRRTILLMTDFGRALLFALVPLGFYLNWPANLTLVSFAGCLGVLGVFYGAAYTGMQQQIWSVQQLGRLNGYFEAVESFAYIVGPLLAGVLVHVLGALGTLLLDGVSFLISGMTIYFIVPQKQPIKHALSEERSTETWLYVWKWLKSQPDLREATFRWGLHRFLFGAWIPTLIYLILQVNHHGTNEIGFLVAAYAFGAMLGALAQPHGPLLKSDLLMMVSGVTALGIGFSVGDPYLLAAFAILFGLCEGYLLVWYLTTRATRVPIQWSGRVYSLTAGLTQGLSALGYLGVGASLSIFGAPQTWQGLGALAFVIGMVWRSHSNKLEVSDGI